jgi:hypothetical protein
MKDATLQHFHYVLPFHNMLWNFYSANLVMKYVWRCGGKQRRSLGVGERGVEDLYKNHITLIPDKYLLMRQETWKIWFFSLPEMGNGPHVRKIKFFIVFSLIGGLKRQDIYIQQVMIWLKGYTEPEQIWLVNRGQIECTDVLSLFYFIFGAPRSISCFFCTLSGCDGGNRTRNIALAYWATAITLLSYGRHLIELRPSTLFSYGRHLFLQCFFL